jgi:REP element-mobilizing transposase RayT
MAEADQRLFRSHGSRQEIPVVQRKLLRLWTNSYVVTTTGGASLPVIKAYIEQ